MTDAAPLDGSNLSHLVVKANGQAPREIPLLDELTIGRAEDNDLKLLDPQVSRHHAHISRDGQRFVLTDLGSANGTFVDGERLSCPHYLRHGERVRIGDVELVFHQAAEATATTLVGVTPAAVAQAATLARPAADLTAGRRPAPAPEPVPAPRREGRGVVVGLGLVAAVLVLAVIAVGAYLLLPGLFGPGDEATTLPTGAVVAPAASPTTLAVANTPEPTQAPTPLPSTIGAEELNDRLSAAQVLNRRSKFEDAIAIYQDLAARAPSDPRPEIGWAWALIYDDQPGLALPHAQKASDLAPSDTNAAVVLARALVDQGNRGESLAHAQRAAKLGPAEAAAHTVLAEALSLNERYGEAVDHADLALVQDINNADAHRARAWLYYLVDQDMGRAMGELHVAAGLQTELWLRRHELGEMMLKARNYTTSIIAFQDALQLRPKAVTYSAIGEAYYELGQYDPARISLAQAVDMGAADARTLGLLANSFAKTARCDDARPVVEDALALDAANGPALEAQATCAVAAESPSAEPTVVAEVTPTALPSPAPTRRSSAAPVRGTLAFPVWNEESAVYDVYMAGINGTGRRLLAAGMDQPALSPTGQWLAMRGLQPDMRNLFIIRTDGTTITRITTNAEDKLPTWSPDGGRLLFASTKDQPGHPKRIYIIDPVRFGGSKIVEGKAIVSGPGTVQADYATWMPDGRIAYQGCDYSVEPMDCGLFVVGSGGGPFTRLTRNAQDTAPSGYGGRIAYMSNRDGNWEIYIVNDDGTGLKRLTNNASEDGLPVWAPDGKTIAFVSNEDGPWAVWAMNPDGSARRKLFDIGGGGLVADWTTQRLTWVP